jgi:hypothetical protein
LIVYYVYIGIWLALVFVLFLLFRYLPPKMKEAEDVKTRQSLFAIMMILSIPIILFVTIVPIIILFSDPDMAVKIKYLFIAIALVVVLLFRLFRKKN